MQPVLFLGHGNPMNAIDDNTFTRSIQKLGRRLSPKAVLVISAHWLTQGTFVTESASPKTIHDMQGFPEKLYQIKYPAPGSPEWVTRLKTDLTEYGVSGDHGEWGFDHGNWGVLLHLLPKAQIPVVQLSLDITQGPRFHYDLAKKLKPYREQGLLIVGSGNIVHNLRKVDWNMYSKPVSWAIEFDQWVKTALLERRDSDLVDRVMEAPSAKQSIPSWDHYLPVVYSLGATDPNEKLEFINEEIQNGSIAMRSWMIG